MDVITYTCPNPVGSIVNRCFGAVMHMHLKVSTGDVYICPSEHFCTKYFALPYSIVMVSKLLDLILNTMAHSLWFKYLRLLGLATGMFREIEINIADNLCRIKCPISMSRNYSHMFSVSSKQFNVQRVNASPANTA